MAFDSKDVRDARDAKERQGRRDMFAAVALLGIVQRELTHPEVASEMAVRYADALLSKLASGEESNWRE